MNKKQVASAQKEGWAIFEAEGAQCNSQGNWPYQLQKCDESAALADDVSAHQLVVAGAKDGKPHSIAALKFLRENSKPELDLILRGAIIPGEELTINESIRTHDQRLDDLETMVFGKVITR